MTLGAVIAAFLNGARVIRAQIVAAVAMMIGNLGLSILFTHWLGVSGVIWGSIAAEGAAVVVLFAVVVPSVLRKLESQQLSPS
jgi:Na+-driven multidrug efflux pump